MAIEHVFVETGRRYNDSGTLTDGWLQKSKARDLCYINPETQKMYIFHLDDLRAAYAAHRGTAKEVVVASDRRKETYGAWLPLSAVPHRVVDLIPPAGRPREMMPELDW